MPAPNEQELILEVRQGSHAAFRVLVQHYMKLAYDVAYGILGDHDEADDVTQESFVKVFRSIASFRGDSSFATWLYRIVKNESLNRVKRTQRRRRREVRLENAEHEESLDESGVMSGEETKIHIERALHELPTLQRAVVMLRHVSGLSTRQVSRILDCSEGTVKTHLHRGMKKMRDRLEYLKEEMA